MTTVMGVYGGIGSMLEGARNAGLTVVGNIEPRDFEDGSTFLHNFPTAFFKDDFIDIDGLRGAIDVVVGHPSCGSYSAINWRADKKPRDEVENFVKAVQTIEPKYFIMDNLPKMFVDYKTNFWYDHLANDYDITPVWVNNSNYGNSQIRRRVYIVGSKKELSFVPLPNENPDTRKTTVSWVIAHLVGEEGKVFNHVDVNHDDTWSAMTNVLRPKEQFTFREMREHVKSWPEGKSFKYYKADGEQGTRIGLTKSRWAGHCPTLSSTARQIHPIRCTPFTIKEQLLLMGYSDEFKIIGQPVRDDGTWKIRGLEYHKVNKGVCVQSIQHFLRQIAIHDEGNFNRCQSFKEKCSMIEEDQNEYVNRFKYQWCQKDGVNISSLKCSFCKMKNVCRKAK